MVRRFKSGCLRQIRVFNEAAGAVSASSTRFLFATKGIGKVVSGLCARPELKGPAPWKRSPFPHERGQTSEIPVQLHSE